MFELDAPPCSEDSVVCQPILDLTGSAQLAGFTELLVGTPLRLLSLLLLALVLRWLLHRVVNRLVKRAESPVGAHLADKARYYRHRRRTAAAAKERAAEDAAEGAVEEGSVDIGDSPEQPPTPPRDPIARARRIQRAHTLGSLFKSIITGVLVAVFGTMMLSEVGVDVAPILASAGIIGVALGFGAQSLVRDFLSGIFMIVEDQFGVGDYINVGEAEGTVEVVTLRMTRMRSLDGTVWYVPNGQVYRVGNMSQNWSRSVVDVGVSYGSDLTRVKKVLGEICQEMWDDKSFRGDVLEKPEVTGVEMLAADGVNLRVLIKTAPMQQWTIAREMRQRIKDRFDAEGIEIPYPQRVVWHRNQADQGKAPAGTDSV